MLTFIRSRVSVLACAIATAALGVDFSLANQSAHALTTDLNCVGTETNNYSPGVKTQPQTINYTATGNFSNCVSLQDLSIQSASFNFGRQTQLSCFSLFTANPLEITYQFNNGEYSTVRYHENIITNPAGQTIVTSIGKVIAGKFLDNNAVLTTSLPARRLPIRCLDFLE
jgi:hypothetical protein